MSRLGVKRGTNTSPYWRCKRCAKNRYRKLFLMKSGAFSKFCRFCRKARSDEYAARAAASPRTNYMKSALPIRMILARHFLAKTARGREVKPLSKTKSKAQTYAEKLIRYPEEVAKIIGKTFLLSGEDALLTDDDALTRIRDLLDDIDPSILEENKDKRLPGVK